MLSITQAHSIMGNNFIGPEELKKTTIFRVDNPDENIPYSEKELIEKKDEYVLIYKASKLNDGKDVTLRALIDIFGKDPDIKEPCFYNQDWYEKESFIDRPLEEGWFLIRRKVLEKSRAVQPTELIEKHVFPQAIICAYAFFTCWLCLDIKLWYHDFIWCDDLDHNGDRVYVGKYHDVDGINKNGFSIHRHLALRNCYGCIDFVQ